MSLTDSKAALSRAAKDLLAKWEIARSVWSDAQADAFERTCLVPLEEDVRSALGAMDHMDQFLQKVQHDCE